MIILDTNVVSELFRPQPDPGVRRWLDSIEEDALFLTVISLAELKTGIELLPEGKRKRELHRDVSAFLSTTFGQRLLSFDIPAAESYAIIRGEMQTKGRGINHQDCQIAAIARTRGFALATRDVEPFRAAGLNVIDPWHA